MEVAVDWEAQVERWGAIQQGAFGSSSLYRIFSAWELMDHNSSPLASDELITLGVSK